MVESDNTIQEDQYGEETLQVIGKAHQFNHWMYETIKPFCKGKILEVGSGIGNISRKFINDKYSIQLSDFNPVYCATLEKEFKDNPYFLGVDKIDLNDPNFDEKFKDLMGSFDTIFALNVVEHIPNDILAIQNCKKLLKKDGHLIILVPAYQFLYNDFDKSLGHVKRYTTKSLSRVFSSAQLNIIHKKYFNLIGILGWFWSGTLTRRKVIPGWQMKIYNWLIPISKVVDKVTLNSVGLSAVVVGKK